MKVLTLMYAILTLVLTNTNSNVKYRKMMKEAENDVTKTEFFLKLVTQEYTKTKEPIFLAYKGLGNFLMAKHSSNPFSKLNYFNNGKRDLDNAVNAKPDNLEIRFYRYVTQSKVPKYLNYNKNLSEDLLFLKENINKTNDTELAKNIKVYLK